MGGHLGRGGEERRAAAGQGRAAQDMAGHSRATQGRAGQNKAGQGRGRGTGRAGQDNQTDRKTDSELGQDTTEPSDRQKDG